MMSTSVMLNNNVGIPNTLNVGSAAMIHHGGTSTHAPPVHSQSHGHGLVSVSNVNVPFGTSGSGPPLSGPGGGSMAGSRPGMNITRPHHHFVHPHPFSNPPAPAPPIPASTAPLPVASTSSSSISIPAASTNVNGTSSAMEVDNEEVDVTPLTAAELQVLSELDSRSFGFLNFSLPENAKKKALVVKAVNQIERLLQEAQEQKDSLLEGATREEIYIENKTFCKLGHFHLLLQDYEKALSAYQKYFSLISGEYWVDSPFMFGLGLVYFHFNCYSWATKLFQVLIYVDPAFSRTNEAHLRLGYMKKVSGDFQGSLKHFKLALADQSPCTLSSYEIRFHIAHLHEISEKPKIAKILYEQILKEKDLPSNLRADLHRQLGWMYHIVDALGEKQQREPIAIHLLEKSLQAEPRSGHTLYLLGRCFASIGRVHDAFIAYRNSVDKSEGNADTWCSIGVLYQQQSQPLDALQAYICAVQLDKFHVAAWTNLGILYESVSQPKDALACFVNASRGFYSQKNKKPMNPSLAQRVQFLQSKLANAPPQTLVNKTSQLPVIENAWNLPISAEMTARQQQQQQAQRQAMYSQQQKGNGSGPPNSQYSGGNGVSQNGVPAKRFKTEEPVHGTSPQVVSRTSAPPPCLSQQQLQILNALQQASQQGQQLTPVQQQHLASLQHQYRVWQQNQQQQSQQTSSRSSVSSFPNTASPRPASSPHSVQSAQPELSSAQAQSFNSSGASADVSQNNQDSLDRSTPKSSGALSTSPFSPNVSDQELQAWLSQGKDLGDEDLLKNVDLDDFDLMDEDELSGANNNSLHSINNNNIMDEKSGTPRALRSIQESDQKVSVSRTTTSPVDSDPYFQIGMNSKELRERCKGLSRKGVSNASILGDKVPPPAPPEPPKMKLTDDQLCPQTPSVLVENKKDAFSPQLQEFCLHHPIAVVRGIAAALKLDLGLFSTKTLVEANPDHAVEVRAQYLQSADENQDTTGRKVWSCYSHRSQTTIQKYASYQASSFKESVEEENDKPQGSHKDSDSDSKDSSGNPKKKKKMIKFGTNVDLSDERKWKDQLQELQKLPAFARVMSAGNMLSHVGHVILGMNTVQLYMKVPGSRTPGHQENNNFCSININIGPGDCEWFAVPDAYWGSIQKLCELNNINYLHGSWWPDLRDCAKAGIPVYRFTQKPGDLVWVNSGCVHWVQAIGWCNNIAWNVGPLTARQYQLGIERYEWNKLQSFKSIVPMVHLSWNLARNLNFSEPNQKLFELVKTTLMRTLVQCFKLLEFAKANNVEVRFHGRQKNDASHYCGQCEVEVFNVLFIREQERRHVVHCIDCARKANSNLQGFMCLEEYKLDDLMKVYDSFVLHVALPSSSSTAPLVLPPTTPQISQNTVASSSSSIPTPSASTLSL